MRGDVPGGPCSSHAGCSAMLPYFASDVPGESVTGWVSSEYES